jgi:hypothetical protein
MNRWNYLTLETTVDTTSGSESYFEHLTRPYLVGACTTQLDDFFPRFPDTFFDQAIACSELPAELLFEPRVVPVTAFAAAANVDADLFQFPPAECASLRHASSTSSPGSNEYSNDPKCSLSYESPPQMPTGSELKPKRLTKTRSRPKLNSIAPHVPGAPNGGECTTRIPHSSVERKYREGLNAELERLRRAVPTLLQSHDGSNIRQPKPSKSMVIAAAINHIETVTQERNILQEENEKIRNFQKEDGGSKGEGRLKKRKVDLVS